MILLSLALTLGWLGVVACVAVAVARARGGKARGTSTAGATEKVILFGLVFAVGAMMPACYAALGVVSGKPSIWLGLVHGVLVLTGVMLISRLMTRIRWALWSDELLTEFLTDVMPVVETAQRRAGDQGSGLIGKARAALKDGRGRDALRHAIEVRTLVENAGLPEHAAWTKVSHQILYWQEGHLS
ncbi:hypothetical protein [Streptomyces sp. NRRL B-24484]|uniref:hypothetical protein n=1 Tax=Streptomyces sp. NRRL B-24484 TaxID=1463833 RepID=UPI0004BEEF19|nr:hypothetical protein [Streptomyces sp. NRRL B-24484]